MAESIYGLCKGTKRKMNNTLICVVSHKDFQDERLKESYEVIHVGSNKLPNGKEWLTDNTGENIAYKNPFYCELTAQYWMWRNLPSSVENVGLVHYRRYFMSYKKYSNSLWDDILDIKEISEVLNNKKIIIPYIKSKGVNGSILYKNKSKSDQSKDWLIIKEIIDNHFPEEKLAFSKIIYSKEQIWSNMLIAKRDVFDAYSKWVFDVLKYYDEKMLTDGEDKRILRVDGFLSELLLLVWVESHLEKKDIANYHVENIDDPFLPNYYKSSFQNRMWGVVLTNKRLLDIFVKFKTNVTVLKRGLFDGL